MIQLSRLSREEAHQFFMEGLQDVKGRGEALASRLMTFPQMDEFWNTVFDWLYETSPKSHFTYVSLPMGLVRLGRHYIEEKPVLTAISLAQRQAIVSKIAKHAKLLKHALNELQVPDSVFWTIEWEDTTSMLSQFIWHIGREIHNDDFEMFEYENAPALKSWDDRSVQARLKISVDDFARELTSPRRRNFKVSPPNAVISKSKLLSSLSDEKMILDAMPEVVAQRGTEITKPRLALIRAFQSYIFHAFGQDDSSSKWLVAAYVNAVFDTTDIGEDTVKDALKGYDYKATSQNGNNEEK